MDLKRSFKSFTRGVSHYFKTIDLTLFATVVAISLFGVLNIYGISPSSGLAVKQLLLVMLGIFLMVGFSFFNYRYLKNHSFPVIIFYLGSLALILVSLASSPIRNIHAWITIGGFTFEPSELMKLALIILLAKYFSQRHIHINQFRHIIVSGIYCAIPTLLILSQPDLGSAVIVVLIWFGILMSAGINKKHFFLLASIGILAAYLSWIFVLKPYQKERIISFINPYKDPTGIGYNIIQSKIAIGSGYFLGSGLGKGSQASLGFLPEPYNDFVFAALSEQFGFIGVVGVFAVLITILYRSVVIGQRTENNFGRLFSLGMVIFLLSHIWISSAVNLGLMPITGIPFSFLSYGGSHLMSLMIGLGILQSIKRYG